MSEHETPAETIRRAIEEMRTDAGLIPSDDMWNPPSASAAADLLEVLVEYLCSCDVCADRLTAAELAALRLARTYLGETP